MTTAAPAWRGRPDGPACRLLKPATNGATTRQTRPKRQKRSRQQDGRPRRPAPLEIPVRIGDTLERIRLPDRDAHVPALDAREQLPAALLELGPLADEIEQVR